MLNEVRLHKNDKSQEIQSHGFLIHSFSIQQHTFLSSFIPLHPSHCQPELSKWQGDFPTQDIAHCSSPEDSFLIKWV